MSSTYTLHHPQLGSILGAVQKNGTTQYRGLPYAHVPGRFLPPIGLNSLTYPISSVPFDATKWGPIAPQESGAEKMDSKILNAPIIEVPEDRKMQDEFRCTNLVITVPGDIPKEKKLPVIVWFHGGAYKVGSANYGAYDTSNLVGHSSKVGMPVIMVSVNRRLNSLGTTASTELGRGIETGNWILKDEREALLWVQRHISGFGGDEGNITYFGESAGSCSGSLHLYSKTRLFDRAILLSGLAGLLPPRPVEDQQKEYLEVCKKLGIETEDPGERARQFLNASAKDIAEPAFDVQTVPTSDGDLIPTKDWVRFENFTPDPDWCKSLLIGSCKDEWAVMALGGGIEKYEKPVESLRKRLLEIGIEGSDVDELFEAFGVSEEQKKDVQCEKLYRMISEYGFRLPAWRFADWNAKKGRNVWLAHMYMGSPFEGVNQGKAHHAIDVVFSFLNFSEKFPKEGGYKELAENMASAWIRYAYGQDPWTRYESKGEGDGLVKVFDTLEKEREEPQRILDEEAWNRWKIMQRIGLDKVWKEGQALLENTI
ncbi:Alpha/Beta hydrolase protein [Pyronema omphalodes]|nr:Alpha/Beta hydrolase protein [Pyronema omphalodes]